LSLTARAATAVTLLLVVLCGVPRESRADYLFIPFIGGTFGGSTTHLTGLFEGDQSAAAVDVRDESESSQRVTVGGSAGWLSSGLLGIEGEFAYTPGIFQRDAERAPPGLVYDSSVMTITGSVIVAVPQSVTGYSLRPYVIGGLGLIHTKLNYDEVEPSVDDKSLGFTVGGGAIGFLTSRTGVRFELRHFRTFEREPSEFGDVGARVSFWRFAVGVVVRR
jgi:opacity protein-like surface antigen